MTDISRRDYLKILGAGAALTAAGKTELLAQNPQNNAADESAEVKADRERRMKWWHDAKFGMFIHWGLYSVVGRHEWVMEMEGIPAQEYERLQSSSIQKQTRPASGPNSRNTPDSATW